MRAENIPINYKTQTAKTSVKVSVLPSKFPKFNTAIVDDSTNPEYNEEFPFSLTREELAGKVLKLSLADHDGGGGTKKIIGFSVLALDSCGLGQGEGELSVKEMMLDIREKVTEQLSSLLSDRLELSLRYDTEHGRLSLGIMLLRIFSLHTYNNDMDIYVKVTLFEGSRVIKAKKTRPLSCAEVLHFNEKFSIRLPSSYLDSVSCVVSLCSRNKFGVKAMMGRTNVGPFAFATGQGLEHWQEMSQRPGQEVVKWHKMVTNSS